jgi:hypothetical protein
MKSMKKVIKYTLALATVALVGVSCTEDFLVRNSKEQLNVDEAVTTVQDLQVALNGAYSQLLDASYYGRNLPVTGDVASDMVKVSPSNSGRFLDEYQYSTIPSDANPRDLWTSAYAVINNVNTVLGKASGISGNQTTIDQIVGEALSIRALAHFDLVRYFAQPYNLSDATIAEGANGTGGHLGVPYMLQTIDGSVPPARESVASNYKNIITDLRKAAGLMASSGSSVYFSKPAAEALLSRVYLYKEQWDSAYYFANKVITSYGFSLVPNASYVASWSQEFTTESILELKNTSTDYRGTNALGYIYLESGYGDLVPTQDVLDLFAAGDVRGTGKDGSLPKSSATMYYKVGGTLYLNKYPGRDGTDGLDNFKLLRLSEIILNRAEAAYHLSDETTARADANTIAKRANPAAEITGSGSILLERILNERRLELAYEGHRLWDLTRNKKSIVRIDHNLVNGTTTYPNGKFAFPIPQAEIDANTNMIQNEAYR